MTRIFCEGSPAAQILEALRSNGRPPLNAGRANVEQGRAIADASIQDLLGVSTVVDADAALLVRSGFLLLANDLDGSHAISQKVSTPDGSYLHGIMHRREGDFSNAQYWFHRVGDHPLFEPLGASARTLGPWSSEILKRDRLDPFRFVDLVEACLDGRRAELNSSLEELQEMEMLLLLNRCARFALG